MSGQTILTKTTTKKEPMKGLCTFVFVRAGVRYAPSRPYSRNHDKKEILKKKMKGKRKKIYRLGPKMEIL